MTLTESSQSLDELLKPRRLFRRLIAVIADLRLAIILLLSIALFSISGTVIEQGESVAFYQQNYPEDPALFGFLSWKWILILGLNHVYSTWWFLSLLVLFGSSLIACTFTRQLPALKVAQRWKFYQEPRQFQKLSLSTELKTESSSSLIAQLEKKGYKIYQENQAIYARKGIIGKIGPIVVHVAIIVILAGSIWGALSGFLAQEMVPSGATFGIKNIIEKGLVAASPLTKNWLVKVNRFWIDYTPDGKVDQFYSDLSVVDKEGAELDHKIIHVNKPLRYDGVTFYQTDWGIAGVAVQINNSPVFLLPMAQLSSKGSSRIWGTWIPTKPDLSEGVSLLAKDLQGTMLVYDKEGNLTSAVRPGIPLEINGVTLKVKDLIGSTGLQIKSDPGIPFVYTGFALLMLGVMMSYVSHSQIWILQANECLYIGGKTNRAQVSFEREFLQIIEEINEAQTPTLSVANEIKN
ncbi:cytochrome c biogenesis protein [Gloeothece verrucosa]|uniref:Cytochrome c biogenesis protein CcsB n=1 Tax=Gloeothece verrucosa (strain PCC 7822) TaxID=497965 RepID=E0UDQ9_GLOV7|nr:cytochrome c biogenesis protein [Gloeothece verrucosa]ADN16494.1 ResB family protein [Gloeothece verrucosa PCC 7822]